MLCGGGVDSAVLLAEAVRAFPAVHPLYVRCGLIWEEAEEAHLRRFLAAMAAGSLQPLRAFDQPIADTLSGHWSLTGRGVPGFDTPDEDSYLPGRNLLIFPKPLVWCLSNSVRLLATAPLGSNPFPDADAEFYDTLGTLAGRAMGGSLRIVRPFADMGLTKAEVIRRGHGLPLEHTFSCFQPRDGLHCGRCAKCGERQRGFRDAGVKDPTHYFPT